MRKKIHLSANDDAPPHMGDFCTIGEKIPVLRRGSVAIEGVTVGVKLEMIIKKTVNIFLFFFCREVVAHHYIT